LARAYTLATAALTLGVSPKWLDNVLSHHPVPGVHRRRQGVARRLGLDGILILGLAHALMESFSIPTGRAIQLADEMATNHGRHKFASTGLSIALDLQQFRAELFARLEDAVEMAAAPKRGRPPANKTGRLN
jgi:hypothetical protein